MIYTIRVIIELLLRYNNNAVHAFKPRNDTELNI